MGVTILSIDEAAVKRARFLFLYFFFMGIFSLPYLADSKLAGGKWLYIYNSFIAKSSAAAYNVFAPGGAEVRGDIISVGGTAVIIKTGCNGLIMSLIFCAGVAAFPAGFRYKLRGFAAGMGAIYLFNIARVCILIEILLLWPEHFDMAHVTAGQFIGIVFSLALWIYWLDGVEQA